MQRVYSQHNAKGCAVFIIILMIIKAVLYKLSVIATQNYSRKGYYTTLKKTTTILYILTTVELACRESFKKVGEVVSQPDLFQLHGNRQDQVEPPHM